MVHNGTWWSFSAVVWPQCGPSGRPGTSSARLNLLQALAGPESLYPGFECTSRLRHPRAPRGRLETARTVGSVQDERVLARFGKPHTPGLNGACAPVPVACGRGRHLALSPRRSGRRRDPSSRYSHAAPTAFTRPHTRGYWAPARVATCFAASHATIRFLAREAVASRGVPGGPSEGTVVAADTTHRTTNYEAARSGSTSCSGRCPWPRVAGYMLCTGESDGQFGASGISRLPQSTKGPRQSACGRSTVGGPLPFSTVSARAQRWAFVCRRAIRPSK